MRRLFVRLAALAGLGAAGVAASRALGSEPEVEGVPNPLPPCSGVPNCARLTRSFATDATTLRRTAEAAIRSDRGLITGRPDEISLTASGLRATYRTGPFADDLAMETTDGADGHALLHLRSSSRVGRSDLGVNRRRLQRLLADVRLRLGQDA